MFRRNTSCLLLLFVCCMAGAQTKLNSPAASSPALFEFHSGFWINLHHFLYWSALSSGTQKGLHHSLTLDEPDVAELQRLSPSENATWERAISYYKDSIAQRDLLFDDGMRQIKNALEDAETSEDLKNVSIPPQLKVVLLKAAPVYRNHWWTRHNQQNRRWIAELEPLVQRYGAGMSGDLVRIYEKPWPQLAVRVDAVAYANWAGAYTTIEPTRPTICTTDPANQGTAALEILFHETSHGMMNKVMDAMHTAEQKVNKQDGVQLHFGSLWHAVLFYTAGELVSERVPGYVPYADKNGLWLRAWPKPDRELLEQDWKQHIVGSVSLQAAVDKLAIDLAKDLQPQK